MEIQKDSIQRGARVMGEYGYAIVTGLITVSVCGVILCCLIIRQQRERQKWKKSRRIITVGGRMRPRSS